MAKKIIKSENIDTHDNRVYPITVRLIKPNPLNKDKIICNNVELFTYKDTVIEDVKTLMKIKSVSKYLIIKSNIKEFTNEIKEEISFDEE